MTPNQYIEWLDKEIAACRSLIERKEFDDDIRTWLYGKLNGLWDAKNHFARFIAHNSLKTIEYPQQETQTENQFIDGLE